MPERFGRYRLIRKLGEGGMGIVHLAHDDDLDRPVAIKILHPGGEGDPRRLLREARSMARLSHPHIAAVFDVGTHGDDVYVAMEYVDGPTLRQWLETPRPWSERFDVLRQAAQGLAAAHASGVVHRDFKPDNVLVGHDGRVRVLDFGLAKLAPRTSGPMGETTDTQLGSLVGTPYYMAPEQLRTQSVGPPADLFAFCLTAYEIAYGERPFSGEVFADVVVSVLTKPPREPTESSEVPVALWPLLRKGLSVEADDRHASMQVLSDALEEIAGSIASPAASADATSPEPPVSRPVLRDAREDARQKLTMAFAEDLIDSDEIDERLESLENAEDPATVLALVADLAPLPVALAVANAPAAVPDGKTLAVPESAAIAWSAPPSTGRIISVFSGSSRSGNWQPARVNKVLTVFGGTELDLREARLPPGEVEINIFVMFGGVDIVVPPGVEVRLDCTTLFGGADQGNATEPPTPGGTVVRVTGVVLFGGVDVNERLPGESSWAARKRHRAHRKALRQAAKAKALPPKR